MDLTHSAVRFEIEAVDRRTGARAGRLHTPRGVVETPVFMPVGTQGTVKTVGPEELMLCGVSMILANAAAVIASKMVRIGRSTWKASRMRDSS